MLFQTFDFLDFSQFISGLREPVITRNQYLMFTDTLRAISITDQIAAVNQQELFLQRPYYSRNGTLAFFTACPYVLDNTIY